MTARLVLTTLAVWLIAVGAQAQSPSHLREAEEAYLNVEFEQVRDHALEALRGGRLTPDQLVRTYELLGVASSALHETDVARDYFVQVKYNVYNYDDYLLLDRYYTANVVWLNVGYKLSID